MGIEIERKFIVKDSSWKTPDINGVTMKQAYLKNSPEAVVRLRIAENTAYITVKGKTRNACRLEFEYEIPVSDAAQMLCLCEKPFIEKIRYPVEFQGMIWVIDVFSGANQGLVIAEIELETRDQVFLFPPWLGREVTDDPGFFNSNLIKAPYSTWKQRQF